MWLEDESGIVKRNRLHDCIDREPAVKNIAVFLLEREIDLHDMRICRLREVLDGLCLSNLPRTFHDERQAVRVRLP